jgi:hypothetical protein
MLIVTWTNVCFNVLLKGDLLLTAYKNPLIDSNRCCGKYLNDRTADASRKKNSEPQGKSEATTATPTAYTA